MLSFRRQILSSGFEPLKFENVSVGSSQIITDFEIGFGGWERDLEKVGELLGNMQDRYPLMEQQVNPEFLVPMPEDIEIDIQEDVGVRIYRMVI